MYFDVSPYINTSLTFSLLYHQMVVYLQHVFFELLTSIFYGCCLSVAPHQRHVHCMCIGPCPHLHQSTYFRVSIIEVQPSDTCISNRHHRALSNVVYMLFYVTVYTVTVVYICYIVSQDMRYETFPQSFYMVTSLSCFHLFISCFCVLLNKACFKCIAYISARYPTHKSFLCVHI